MNGIIIVVVVVAHKYFPHTHTRHGDEEDTTMEAIPFSRKKNKCLQRRDFSPQLA